MLDVVFGSDDCVMKDFITKSIKRMQQNARLFECPLCFFRDEFTLRESRGIKHYSRVFICNPKSIASICGYCVESMMGGVLKGRVNIYDSTFLVSLEEAKKSRGLEYDKGLLEAIENEVEDIEEQINNYLDKYGHEGG